MYNKLISNKQKVIKFSNNNKKQNKKKKTFYSHQKVYTFQNVPNSKQIRTRIIYRN